mgnify:CR=1 FL=1
MQTARLPIFAATVFFTLTLSPGAAAELPPPAQPEVDFAKDVRPFFHAHAFAGNGAGGSPAWVKDLRSNALGRFRPLGFPTTKPEAWRFTHVQQIADPALAPPVSHPAHPPSTQELHAHCVAQP